MDLLRNLGSAAATSLLQKSGITLPYSLGDIVSEYSGKSIWTLYDATKKVRTTATWTNVSYLSTRTTRLLSQYSISMDLRRLIGSISRLLRMR